jgi:FHA domain-containing protein
VPRSIPGSSLGGSSGGLGDLGAPLSSSNPFADLLGDPVPLDSLGSAPAVRAAPADASPAWGNRRAAPPPPAAAGVSVNSTAWAPTDAVPPRALLPDDFDPFAPAPARTAAPPPPTTEPLGLFGDLVPATAPGSIDALFGLGDAGRDPLGDFMADIGRPPSQTDAVAAGLGPSTDPLAMFGPAPAAPAPFTAAPAAADRVSDLRAAYTPPAVRPERMPTSRDAAASAPLPPSAAPEPAARFAAAAAARASSGDPADAQALWAAFCEGAGISANLPNGPTPELMRAAGSLLQAAVDGTLQLMMVRATAKHELRAEVTVIQARNNNPLKFSPDARSALEQLLQPPLRGFLPGPAAMTDAMHDLVGHTIGTMAGTRAALEGVLDRFTPQQLEAKLAGRSMLDSVLPMNRKAKLWELYLQHYDAIRNEAQEDFHSLFGRAFLAAYEQQLDRLQGGVPGATPGPV